MSFGGKPDIPTKSPKPAGLSNSDFSTNQEAVPVLYFSGDGMMPLTWVIDTPLNVVEKELKGKVGKKTQTTGYEYFCDVAGVAGLGVLYSITAIEVDGTEVWSGNIVAPTSSGHPDYYRCNITCDAFKAAHVYWGRMDQPVDTYVLGPLGASNPSLAHPAYRGQILVTIEGLKCGSAQSVPSVVIRGRRVPTPQIGTFPTVGTPQGESIVASALELATNPIFGAGLPSEVVPVANWEAISAHVISAVGGLSPFLDRARPLRDVLRDWALYYDGWYRIENGQIRPGAFPHNGITPTGLVTLDVHAWTEKPEWEIATASDSVNDVTVIFRDRTERLKESPAYGVDSANRRTRRASSTVSMEMPAFIDADQAEKWAAEAAMTASEGNGEGKGTTRASRAVLADGSLMLPGSNFIFDDAIIAINQVVRLRRRVDPFKGPVSLEFVTERGVYPTPYIPPRDTRPRPGKALPQAATTARIFELPRTLSRVDEGSPVALLAMRPKAVVPPPFSLEEHSVSGFNAFYSDGEGTAYAKMTTERGWVCAGTLSQALAASSSNVVVKVAMYGNNLDLDRLEPQNNAAADNDVLLILIGNELFSVEEMSLSGLNYEFSCRRGRFETVSPAHSVGEGVWVFYRDEIATIDTLNVPQGATRYFKLQTFTEDAALPLADAPVITYTFADRAPPPASGLTATAGTGKVVWLDWIASPGAYVTEYQILRRSSVGPTWILLAAEVSGVRFADFNVVLGVTYTYMVRAMSDEEQPSAWSNEAAATPTSNGLVDPTPPADPAAPTLGAAGVKTANDGTVNAWRTVILPAALPSGAACVEVLYRYVIDGVPQPGWIIGDQKFILGAGSNTSTLDDLTPNSIVEYALRSVSMHGIAGNVISGGTFTAATKTGKPSTPPAAVTIAPTLLDGVSGCYQNDQIVPATLILAPASMEPDVDAWEWWIGALVLVPANGSAPVAENVVAARIGRVSAYTAGAAAFSRGVVLRKRTRSGVWGDWSTWQLANLSTNYAGSLGSQNSTDVRVSSVKTGSPGVSGVDSVRARRVANVVVNLAGGLTYVDLPLTGKGFSTAPVVANVTIESPAKEAECVYSALESTSANMRVYFYNRASPPALVALSAGLRRFQITAEETS